MSVQQIKANIIANRRIALRHYNLVLEAPALARAAKPGNFLMVKADDGAAPLLRRPLSIHRAGVSAGAVDVLYEVVGPGTEALSRKKAGERVDVIGPLGNAFSLDARKKNMPVLLVAGGMGVAPLVFLAQRLKPRTTTVLIGARTKTQVLCAREFRALGCTVRIATDDGSSGFHGRVTELLEDILSRAAGTEPAVYGCGPKPMLKAMAGVCRAFGSPAQVSLEAHMACGIGACLGCVVQTTRGYERVCKEGPVFEAADLVW